MLLPQDNAFVLLVFGLPAERLSAQTLAVLATTATRQHSLAQPAHFSVKVALAVAILLASLARQITICRVRPVLQQLIARLVPTPILAFTNACPAPRLVLLAI